MISVTLYGREDCHLCDQALEDLKALQEQYPHRLVVIDVDGNTDLLRAYGLDVPVVEVGPYRLKAPITRQELAVTLGAATDRARDLEAINSADYQTRMQRGWKVTGADRFSYWLSRHYMTIFNTLVLIYVGLPFLAPVFMALGFTAPARLIYRGYGAVCHQFAFRSWFLFGEQPVYPREAARIEGMLTYSQATGLDETDQLAARQFLGNPQLGYKIALCERDVAIYGGILLFGLVFSLTGKRLKSLPWYIWILVGILPVAVDGISQLLSQPPFNTLPVLSQIPYRESTPFLRTLTGGLFGLATAWFGYPMVEETMVETRRFMALKFARVRELQSEGAIAGEGRGDLAE
jgi:uncharacterized membrane protein